MTEAFETGPYLQAALFCERVLDEKDNVKSLIRVIDRLQVQSRGPQTPEAMPEVRRDLVAYLSFKSGSAVGPVPMRITLTRPSGLTDSSPLWQATVHFEGGTRGVVQTLRMRVVLREAGPYWFNLYVEDRLVTRMPFEVIYTTLTTTAPGSQPPPL